MNYEELFEESVAGFAAELGCDVVLSDECTLQLDLDSDEDYKLFQKQFDRLISAGVGMSRLTEEWRSRSGNRHVEIKLSEPADVPTRVMLQALLGSDRVREALNLRRHRLGVENPIRLFRPYAAARRLNDPAPEDFDIDDLPF